MTKRSKLKICGVFAALLSLNVSGQNYINSTGNVGINTVTQPATAQLQVNGHTMLGDGSDPTQYGLLQIVRPSSPGDNKFHLSFIRNGMSVSGMGYMPGSNTIGIWHANNNAGVPAIAITTDQKVGIGVSVPAEKLTIGGSDGNIFIGNIIYAGYNGICLNGSSTWTDYNFLSKASDNNLYINRPASAGIFFRAANNTQMMIHFNGNVSLGLQHQTAEAKLDILTGSTNDGAILRNGSAGFIKLHSNSMTLGSGNPITRAGDAGFTFGGGAPGAHTFGFVLAPWSNSESGLRINNDGRVSIGTWKTSTGYKLFVEEGIRTRKVRVDQVAWADYVFDEDYRLKPLDEVAGFIAQHKHLPDVPSAAQVAKEGLDLGSNQAILLQKIEELTLYVLQLKKENELQSKAITQLQKATQK